MIILFYRCKKYNRLQINVQYYLEVNNFLNIHSCWTIWITMYHLPNSLPYSRLPTFIHLNMGTDVLALSWAYFEHMMIETFHSGVQIMQFPLEYTQTHTLIKNICSKIAYINRDQTHINWLKSYHTNVILVRCVRTYCHLLNEWSITCPLVNDKTPINAGYAAAPWWMINTPQLVKLISVKSIYLFVVCLFSFCMQIIKL
jgi:hypothetical protein